ncbi:MAG: hypothetical protein PF518_04535 [Spirochaetaceae bacterium]|nr:hypothetical protein [Spirochaetaceae bacterium]
MKYFLFTLFFLTLNGCHFYNIIIEKFEIQFPETIPEILQDCEFYWILKYHEMNGQFKVVELDKKTERIFLPVQKGISQVFTLTGVVNVKDCIQLYTLPAGFIYPGDTKNGRYNFDWNLGFESSLLFSLEDYIDLEQINIKKLFTAIDERAEQKNHWIIDREVLLENLISRDFRIYDIRRKRERTLELNLPGGIWYNLNPLGENINSLSEINPTEVLIYTGFHSFYNKNGMVLEIDLKENGEYCFILY